MGDIGAEKLKNNGKTTTPKNFQIRLQDCVFRYSGTTMATTFTGNPFLLQIADNYYTMFQYRYRCWHLTMLAWRSVTLLGTSYAKASMGIDQNNRERYCH